MAYIGNTPEQQAFTPAIDYFNGNGSTVAFTLSRPVASVAQVQAVIENVPQNPGDAFTVSGNTITFTSAPPSGTNNIYVYYTSPITQVVALPQSPQVFGNLQFSSAGARITGDFSNATITNRVAIQSSTTNGATSVGVLPNGTETTAQYLAFNAADPTNSACAQLLATSSEVRLGSTIAGTGTYLPLTFRTGGSERLRIDTSGNVGIGTSSPVSGSLTLNIGRNLAWRNNAGNFTATAGSSLFKFTDDNLYIDNYDATNIVFRRANYAESMRITRDGNLLARGSSEINSYTAVQIFGTGAVNDCLGFKNSNTSSLSAITCWNSSGSYVGGMSFNNTNTSFPTSSDYRLKENIAPMTGALAKVAQLKPVTYTWKLDGSDGQGFIAHELAEVCPDAVIGEKDAVNEDGSIKAQAIDTSFLVATLTAAIQEQQAIITDLKARIEVLENK